MEIKKLLLLLTAIFIFSIALPIFSSSQKPFQGFILTLPEEIVGNAGETVEAQGTILNFGIFWLHNFDLVLTGLPEGFEYNITPSHFEDVRILREWNPERGVYRAPENFTLSIKIPQNASGLFAINVTGQEKFSWRQAANSSVSVLRIRAAVAPAEIPRITASDIVVPENVTEGIPFELNLSLNNEGNVDSDANVSIEIPEDWVADEKTKSVFIGAGSTTKITFSVTPSASPGNISVRIDYPVNETIITLTRSGPYLIPISVEEIIIPETEVPLTELPTQTETTTIPTIGIEIPSASGLIAFIQTYSALIIIVGIVILAIILWQVAKLYEVKNIRRRPETF